MTLPRSRESRTRFGKFTFDLIFTLHPIPIMGPPLPPRGYFLDSSGRLSPVASSSGPILPRLLRSVIAVFLPAHHRVSVRRSYLTFSLWQAGSSVSSSAAGVLATQSLLFAAGLGEGALPTAAALNWVIKDGIGQIGGVLYAAALHNKLDADPKRWRFLAGLALDVATGLEIMAPLAPGCFLIVASIANVGKNIAWITTSATKAGIHRNLSLRENLADITAKSASQTTACMVVGTGVGILVSKLVGADVAHVAAAFTVIAPIHMVCNFFSLKAVTIHTINRQRLERIYLEYTKTKCVLSPEEMANLENFILPFKSHWRNVKILHGLPFHRVVQSNCDLDNMMRIFNGKNYILNVRLDECKRIWELGIIWSTSAEGADIIEAFLHAFRVSDMLQLPKQVLHCQIEEIIQTTRLSSEALREILDLLSSSGWDIEHQFLELKRLRFEPRTE